MTWGRHAVWQIFHLFPIVLLLALWQLATSLNWVDRRVLPSLFSVWIAFRDLLSSGELMQNLGATVATSFGGLLIGLVLGTGLGLAMAVSRAVEGFANPLVRMTYALPKTALIPLLVLWFGVGGVTNLLVVVVTTLLPVVVYTFQAARGVPLVLRWSALSLGTPPVLLPWFTLLPAALPAIATAARIALGFAFVVSIACEMVVSNLGIGKLMFVYGDNGNYDYMFAALVVVILTAYLADSIIASLSNALLPWNRKGSTRG